MVSTIISVDGNIGSGKSTLVSILKCHYKCDVVVLTEPVDSWNDIKEDETDENIISKFYKDKDRYSFSFQMLALITRISEIRKVIKTNPKAVIITERSIDTDRNVFCKMLYDEGYKIYMKCYNEFIDEFPTAGTIYLYTSPSVCHKRILLRNRKGENIDINYLEKCSEYHDNWLKTSHNLFIKLDGNIDIYKSPILIRGWIKQISGFLETFAQSQNQKKIFTYYHNYPYETYIKHIQEEIEEEQDIEY